MTEVALLSTFECSFGIIVACAPELRGFLDNSVNQDLENGCVSDSSRSDVALELTERDPTGYRKSIPGQRKSGPRQISGDFEFVRGWSGRYIFKHVDFEVRSSLASENTRAQERGRTRRMESWETMS
jgi:hypothetical protein